MRNKIIVLLCSLSAMAGPAFSMPFERQLNLPGKYQAKRITKLFKISTGQTATLMDIKGAGCITHIWMTFGCPNSRRVVLRMYWDGEDDPSVESPMTDFFGVGHNEPFYSPKANFAHPCLTLSPRNGYNVYLPMPFARSAKITITNDLNEPIASGGGMYFQADYMEFDKLPADVPYLHTQWRREYPTLRRARPYTILQAVGEGFIAGMTYHLRVEDKADAWVHGGGDIVYIDGNSQPSCIKGIGGEDYFGQAWGIKQFVTPYAGCTFSDDKEISIYRFYLEGPVPFKESARLAFGTMANETTSVGYWYQTEPHHRFYKFPEPPLRDPDSKLEPGRYDMELLPQQQLDVAVIGPFAGDINTPFAPEEKIDLNTPIKTNYKQPYKTVKDYGLVRWESARTTLSWLDFDALYKPKMTGPRTVQTLRNTVSYGYLRLHADRKRSCRLLLGHDDAVRIWLNGERIANLGEKPGFAGEEIVLKLQEGSNDLLIKSVNGANENWYAYAISLSFSKLKGITFENFETLPAAPEYATAP